jgi:gamma-glutamyltranspeptidase
MATMPQRPLVPAVLARGARAAVVAPHHLATAAGLSILREGGHAVDAAIAANAVLSVVAPNACGIGGDAFWLIWDEAAQSEVGLNGSGRAAAASDPARLRSSGYARMPLRGPLPITVPGAVRSWGDAHDRYGRLSRSTVLAPAIELAGGGFPAWDGFIEAVERTAPLVESALGRGAAWFAVYRPHDRPWRPGELVRLPAQGATLARLAEVGWGDFYEGRTGALQAAALAEAGSPLTLDDLRSHASTWTEPIAVDYRGVTVTSHPPNSSGMVALELLAILAALEPPQPGVFAEGQGADARWVHLGIEAAKLAFADRDRWLTDPDTLEIPVGELLDPRRAARLAASIDPARASRPEPSRNPPGGGTAYLATVDGDGNAVSLIESNYQGFGSCVVDPATGIGYHNRGSYFSLDPDHPNVLAPRKRTLHTLLPGMLLRDGRPWVVAGSMGGDAQPQIHAQLVTSLIDGGVDIAAAVAAPRWFVEPALHFSPPVDVCLEPRFRPGIGETLASIGHPVSIVEPFDSGLGHCHAIELVDGGPARGGSLAATTDPRSAGLPAVW